MLREAVRAVHENITTLLLVLMFDAPLTLGMSAFNDLYMKPREDDLGDRVGGLISTGESILQIFLFALLYSIFLSRLARSLDRPLWKVHGARDAIARFFPMWLVMFFVCTAFIQFGMMFFDAGYENAGQGFQWIGIILNMMIVPFAAIVMFLGNGHGDDIRTAALTVLPRIPDRFFLALLIAFMQIVSITMMSIDESTTFWMRPVISAANIYVDFVLFSYIFLSCREQRDLEEPQDPYDP